MRDRRVAETTRPGRRGAWAAVVLAGVLAVGAVVDAQGPQPPRPGQPAGIAPSDDPLAVFRSGITLVTTDVIVRDENDLFIPDLTKDDFIILEDGIPQEVASLVLVHGGRVYNQLLPPPPVQEGIILPPTRPVNDTAGRIIVILVDDLHIEANKTPKARQVFEKLADTLIHEGDLFGIVSTGPSSIRVDLTYDRNRLYSAMGRITGDGFTANELINEVSPGTRGPEELRWRAHVAFKTARDTVLGLEQVQNRRKAVIYFSSGYDFNPFEFERYFARDPIARSSSRAAPTATSTRGCPTWVSIPSRASTGRVRCSATPISRWRSWSWRRPPIGPTRASTPSTPEGCWPDRTSTTTAPRSRGTSGGCRRRAACARWQS